MHHGTSPRKTNRNDIIMNNKDLSSQRDCVHRVGCSETFSLTAEFLNPTEIRLERFKSALGIYSTWLARAVIRRADLEVNASRSAAHSTQPALTSHPDNCTVGTPRHCKTGGSDK